MKAITSTLIVTASLPCAYLFGQLLKRIEAWHRYENAPRRRLFAVTIMLTIVGLVLGLMLSHYLLQAGILE